MREAEFLFTIAEVAAAFAGFSTLVVVVAQRLAGVRSEVVTGNLGRMLALSLMAVFFALFPYLPAYLEADSSLSWRFSSGLFFIAWASYWVNTVQGIRNRQTFRAISTANRANVVVTHPAALLVLAIGAFGGWAPHTAFAYLCSLLGLLSLAGFLFLQQVLALSRPAA